MLRLFIKLLALYLLWKLVVAPLLMAGIGWMASVDRFFHTQFWWMSPAAAGW